MSIRKLKAFFNLEIVENGQQGIGRYDDGQVPRKVVVERTPSRNFSVSVLTRLKRASSVISFLACLSQ